MLTFTSTTDPRLYGLPPPAHPVVVNHLNTLMAIFGRGIDHYEDGFVGYIEGDDTPQSVRSEIGRDISDLEIVFRDGPYLVGILLWGNSGSGVTLVCPDLDEYAPEIVHVLRKHL